MYFCIHVSTLYSCEILMKNKFLHFFSKNIQISNIIKVRPVGVGLFYADIRMDRLNDGRTDMTKIIVALETFRTRQNSTTKREINKYTNAEFSNNKLHYTVPNCEMSKTYISCNM
jgi:hypothetical protein